MNSPQSLKISARKSTKIQERICQGDIFENIEIIEDIKINGSKIIVDKICFPYIICLNQECDLETDFKIGSVDLKDSRLLHLAIAPAFNFEQFLLGGHWGDIFRVNRTSKRKDTKIQIIMDNEIPRFHYLKFLENDIPELIVDFKHFFTVNRDFLYKNMGKRICSLDDLFKEKISQRFSNFISRIGLPEENLL